MIPNDKHYYPEMKNNLLNKFVLSLFYFIHISFFFSFHSCLKKAVVPTLRGTAHDLEKALRGLYSQKACDINQLWMQN